MRAADGSPFAMLILSHLRARRCLDAAGAEGPAPQGEPVWFGVLASHYVVPTSAVAGIRRGSWAARPPTRVSCSARAAGNKRAGMPTSAAPRKRGRRPAARAGGLCRDVDGGHEGDDPRALG